MATIDPERKLRVMFLCTGNACRSQMSEGWARRLHGDRIEAHSAGVAPIGVDPRAVQVMSEAGVDISEHWSKHLDELSAIRFDWVVTVCDHAREVCPVPPAGARALHAGFDDPPMLTLGMQNEEACLQVYREVRDQIRDFMQGLPERLAAADSDPVT